MLDVFEEKQRLEIHLGQPSFSLGLGLTQDENFNHDCNEPINQVNALFFFSLFIIFIVFYL